MKTARAGAEAAAPAWGWGVGAIGVHHMEAHLLAPMLEAPTPEFPFLALLVSGGHTQLVAVSDLGRYRVLGESLDDAAGEAFDKTAKLLGLGYPGGPPLERLAQSGRAGRYRFPRPMTDRPGLDFSFSGLKTHTLMTLRQAGSDPDTRAAGRTSAALTLDAQHIGGAGIAGPEAAGVRVAPHPAHDDGRGQRAQEVGEADQ